MGKTYIDCGPCDGHNGRNPACQQCYGMGVIECPTCNGKGIVWISPPKEGSDEQEQTTKSD